MNTSNVISLAAVGDLLPYRRVKMTANGIDYAGAADKAIGMTLPGDLNRNYPTVQLFGAYGEAVMGSSTAVAAGDEIEAAADGKVVKKDEGTAAGVVVTGGTTAGDRVNVIYYF